MRSKHLRPEDIYGLYPQFGVLTEVWLEHIKDNTGMGTFLLLNSVSKFPNNFYAAFKI